MSRVNVEKITAELEKQLKIWNVPGVSLGIIQDDEIVFSGGVGLRDNEKEPFTKDTLIQIGSCTKAFTAALIARLATEGLLDMDTPVSEYIPDFRLSDDYATLHLTIRDFLSHRSGLPRHEYAWYGSGFTRSGLMHNLRFLQMTQPPRYRYQYSNFNYLIAGALVEAVTGMKFENALVEKLIKPLGMEKTFVYLDLVESMEDHALPFDHEEDYVMTGSRLIPYYEAPEFGDVQAGKREGDPVGPAGCIVSCAEDMLKWVRFNLKEGKIGEEQFVRADLMKLITTSHIDIGDDPSLLPERSMASYALGWFVYNYRGHKMLEHGGSLPGMTSSVSFIPDLNLGICMTANMNVTLLTEALFSEIIDDALGVTGGNWYERFYRNNDELFKSIIEFFRSFGGEAVPDTTPSHPLSDYTGIYTAPGYNRFAITEKDGVLKADFNAWSPELKHLHYDSFSTTSAIGELPAGLVLTFAAEGTGDIKTLSVMLGREAGLKPIVFTKQ